MITFREFIGEAKNEGTYVCVRFTEESNKKLREYALSLGLDPIKDFHATVVYSEKSLEAPVGVQNFTDTLTPKSLKYLGELDSEYRALVLEVDSEGLQSVFDHYVDNLGYEHRFDSFVQHISLAYKPPENLLINIPTLPDFNIQVDRIMVEPLNKSY